MKPPLTASKDSFTPAQLAEGERWYFTYCSICHTGPVNPNLMRSALATDAQAWQSVVHGGALKDNGMISFAPYLSTQQVESVRGYVLGQAKKTAAEGQK